MNPILRWLSTTGSLLMLISMLVMVVWNTLYPIPKAERRKLDEQLQQKVRKAQITYVRSLETSCGYEPWYDDFWYDMEREN